MDHMRTGPIDSTMTRSLTMLALFIFAVLLYSGTLNAGFVWDDSMINITNNSLVKDAGNIPSYFVKDYAAGSEYERQNPYYRPLFKVSIAIDHLLWKENPFGYHLTNILFHGFVAILVYLIILRTCGSMTGAFAGAILFSAHPVHSETVSYIANRTDLLSVFFVLVSFYFYIIFRENGNKRYLAISLGIFFAALLTKEMAVTLPGVMFLYEVCFFKGSFRGKLKWPSFYILIAIVPYMVLRMLVLEHTTWAPFPLPWRIYTSIGIVAKYLKLLIYPIGLKVGYDIPVQKELFTREVLSPLIVLCLVVPVLGMTLWKKEKRGFFGLAWIFVTLFPVSGLPALITSPFPMAEHCLYLPSVGFAILAGVLFVGVLNRVSIKPAKNAILAIGVIVLSVFALENLGRQSIWRNELTLWSTMVQDAPNSTFAYNNLAGAYLDVGRLKDAEGAMLRSLELDPRNSGLWLNLAKVFFDQGRKDEALNAIHTAIRINPKNKDAFSVLETFTRENKDTIFR